MPNLGRHADIVEGIMGCQRKAGQGGSVRQWVNASGKQQGAEIQQRIRANKFPRLRVSTDAERKQPGFYRNAYICNALASFPMVQPKLPKSFGEGRFCRENFFCHP